MSVAAPTWTLNAAAVLARTTLAAANINQFTWDLRGKFMGRLYAAAGRAGTTAITGSPLSLIVRPIHNNGAHRFPVNPWGKIAGGVTALAPTISGTQNAPQSSLTLSSTTSMVAGDLICVGYNTSNEEYCRVAKVTSGTVILLDAPTINNHANAEVVTTQADIWIIPVPGGSLVEVVFDYGACSAGPTLSIQAWGETYDSDTIT